MEAGAAPRHLTLTLRDGTEINKEQREREREDGKVANNKLPPSEVELFLSVFGCPTF